MYALPNYSAFISNLSFSREFVLFKGLYECESVNLSNKYREVDTGKESINEFAMKSLKFKRNN